MSLIPAPSDLANVNTQRGTRIETHSQPNSASNETQQETDVYIGSQRRKIHQILEDLQEIFDAGTNASQDQSSLQIFQGMYESASNLFNKFSTLYDELMDSQGLSETPAEDKLLRQQAKRLYYGICTSVKVVGADRPSLPPSSSTLLNHSALSGRAKAKLPPIEIPTFDGRQVNWPRFKDTFESMVINDPRFTDIDKYHYLVKALEGNASTVIAPITFSAADFSIAWQALLEAYDNPRLLATAYMEQLLNVKPLTSKPSNEQLKKVTRELSEWVASFNNIKIDDKADFLMFFLIRRWLDKSTREAFEHQYKHCVFPKCDDLFKFLRQVCRANELASSAEIPTTAGAIKSPLIKSRPHSTLMASTPKTSLTVSPSDVSRSSPTASNHRQESQKEPQAPTSSDSVYSSCPICKGRHTLMNCPPFNSMSVEQRLTHLSQWRGCKNCLFASHPTHKCISKWRCKFCRGRHHSLLHLLESTNTEAAQPKGRGQRKPNTSPGPSKPKYNSPAKNVLNVTALQTQQVMLGTAMCSILDSNGKAHQIRIALDSGSQFSFLTYNKASQLGLMVKSCKVNILGIGQTPLNGFKGRADCQLVSCIEPIKVSTQALVIDTITSDLPSSIISHETRQPYMRYSLADPEFWNPRPIDFLLGSDLFAEILTGDIITVAEGQPKLIGTIFGYVAIGRVADISEVQAARAFCATTKNIPPNLPDLLDDLHHLWDLDEPPNACPLNPDDAACEEHYKATHSRLPSGRYVVRLPFKSPDPPEFPSTRWMAIKRLSHVEGRLARNPELCHLYVNFMKEYQDLGHMRPASSLGKYIIPHHGVLKLEGSKPKIRVVFDASARTSNGSLNDYLHVGPKLQNSIFDITLNFRRPKIGFVVDLVKMFRQILLHPDDRIYQHILWRKDPGLPMEEFELCTVSYGQACASFLAIRSLMQLVYDHGEEYPLAASAILHAMYVDDIATGADTLEDTLELQRQIVDLLAKGEFTLSKWASNHPAVLESIRRVDKEGWELPRKIEDPADKTRLKVLGMQWNPTSDCFSYEVVLPELVLTKRAILAAVSRIYDPLGLLGPLVISAKLLIQLAWKAGIGWDDALPESLQGRWKLFVRQLPCISSIRIPRCISPEPTATYELLVFGDASEKAYCAVAYLKCITSSKQRSKLLVSKTKLAPIKPLTIPRLELCAALLVARLLEALVDFRSKLPSPPKVFLFTDSTVVLGWLHTPPHLLKTFVANRVVQILETTSTKQWFHVRSDDNPGDLGSRGLEPEQLVDNHLWFYGPEWAIQTRERWPIVPFSSFTTKLESLPEVKGSLSLAACKPEEPYLHTFIAASSSYTFVTRMFAWVMRFITNCKVEKAERRTGPLSCDEIMLGTTICVKVTQQHSYQLRAPFSLQAVPKALISLNPFLDQHGVLRVGGRVALANLPYSTKHPIIIPAKSHLSTLIIGYHHKALFHPGPSLLLSVIRRRFWIVGARNQIKKFTRECVQCRKLNAVPCQPMMSNLPPERLQGSRPFINVGVDFAGPLLIRESLRRKALVSKCYLCIFICLGSRAVHLELVSSASTPAFTAALDRFISRRGHPSVMFSDNGTNFVGAANQLKEWYHWFRQTRTQQELEDFTSLKQIQWRFTPPYAPHFGGSWEAGVKSAKRLLRSTYGEGAFTYEELATILCRIEAILNSRPICPMSSNPDDLDPLTPAHLIIGEPLVALPEHSLLDRKERGLERWKLVIQRTQRFWKRWQAECLHELQIRTKWRKPQENLAVNDMVLIKGEDTDRLKWPIGRIINVFPGADGIVRVAEVRTTKTTLKRPVTKLIPLLSPTENANERPAHETA